MAANPRVMLISCILQEGAVPIDRRREALQALRHVVASYFPRARVLVVPMELPRGFGFTAGRLSSSSVVQVGVPRHISLETRAELLQALSGAWCDATGQTPFELMVATPDRDVSLSILRRWAAQMSVGGSLRTLFRALRSAPLS